MPPEFVHYSTQRTGEFMKRKGQRVQLLGDLRELSNPVDETAGSMLAHIEKASCGALDKPGKLPHGGFV